MFYFLIGLLFALMVIGICVFIEKHWGDNDNNNFNNLNW